MGLFVHKCDKSCLEEPRPRVGRGLAGREGAPRDPAQRDAGGDSEEKLRGTTASDVSDPDVSPRPRRTAGPAGRPLSDPQRETKRSSTFISGPHSSNKPSETGPRCPVVRPRPDPRLARRSSDPRWGPFFPPEPVGAVPWWSKPGSNVPTTTGRLSQPPDPDVASTSPWTGRT